MITAAIALATLAIGYTVGVLTERLTSKGSK